MNSRAKTAILVMACGFGLVCSGCGPDSYEAGTEAGNKAPAEPAKKQTAPSVQPSATPTVEPVAVCDEVTADDVTSIMGLPDGTKVGTKDVSSKAEAGVAANFACQYDWKKGKLTQRLRISVVPVNSNDDPQKVLVESLGGEPKPIEGVGDVAGFVREGSAGPGNMVFTAVQKTDRGLSSVNVTAPAKADEKQLSELAKDLLGKL